MCFLVSGWSVDDSLSRGISVDPHSSRSSVKRLFFISWPTGSSERLGNVRLDRDLSKQHHKMGTKHLKYDFVGDNSSPKHRTSEGAQQHFNALTSNTF